MMSPERAACAEKEVSLDRPDAEVFDRGYGRYKGEITPSPAQCRSTRRGLGWCRTQLAAAADLTEKTVKDFETGARTPHPRTLIAIRRAFRRAGTTSDPNSAALQDVW
jgi:DNA-binding XRE family transcriptional regulator